jgi:hypothetical protein
MDTNFWEESLVDDIRTLIFDSLPMTPQLCMARTCKREWTRRGLHNFRWLHLSLAEDVVQGGTPLWMVKQWMLDLQQMCRDWHLQIGGPPRLRHASMSLAEALASQGWLHDDIVNMCCASGEIVTGETQMDRCRITFHERHITCDILRGYIRGNFIHHFAETLALFAEKQVLEYPRPASLFIGRLYELTARLNRRDIMPYLLGYGPVEMAGMQDIFNRNILNKVKTMVRALWNTGQFEWFHALRQKNMDSIDVQTQIGSSWMTRKKPSASFEELIFGVGNIDKSPEHYQWTQRVMLKHMDKVVDFDHRFVDYILGYFPTFLTICKHTDQWTNEVWGRGRLEDLQWLETRSLLTFESFMKRVMFPCRKGITSHNKPWPARSYQRRDHYTNAFVLAEKYLVKNPVTQYLHSLGYYVRALRDLNNRGTPMQRNFYQNLRADMRAWLLAEIVQ